MFLNTIHTLPLQPHRLVVKDRRLWRARRLASAGSSAKTPLGIGSNPVGAI